MKLVIASLIIFSIIILFLFALFPSDISVTRVLRINGKQEQINNKIGDLRQWKNWNEFVIHPPQRDIRSGQSDITDSALLRIGAFTISIQKNQQDTVVTEWKQGDKSFSGKYVLTEVGNQTIVEWTLFFHVKWYPWEKLASMFYDKQLGPAMEKSLLNLQKNVK